jgi:hypothetical protein
MVAVMVSRPVDFPKGMDGLGAPAKISLGPPARSVPHRSIFETICKKPGVLLWNGEQILE